MIDKNTKDFEGDGEWGRVVQDELIQIHSMVLPNGKVLSFGTDGTRSYYDARFVYSLYDPETGETKVLPNTTGTNIFCSNMSIDPNTGNVIIMGGDNKGNGATWSGRNDVVVFDYKTETLRNISEEVSDFALHQARWYGTTLNLSNGDIMMIGGRDENFNGSTVAEIYNHETGMRQLTGVDIEDLSHGDGTLYGVYYYVHAWQVSDGSVIMIESGGNTNSGHDVFRIDTDGEGSYERLEKLPFSTRNLSGSIMYEPDKVLVASNMGEVWKADLSQPNPTWELAFTIPQEDGTGIVSRTNGTFAMMPDGKVAIVGGSSSGGLLADNWGNAQKTVLFWDPDTEKITFSEAQDNARMYHSTGLILPTGEVWAAGGGAPGPQNNTNAQILTPEYLFEDNGDQVSDRPEILHAPGNVETGSNFRITVDDTSDIGKISFIKSGAATHARNADTRFVELDYKIIDENTVQVEIPEANIAIPGLWMLFVVDNDGVPSVASMTGVDMVDIIDTGDLEVGATIAYNIDEEQIDGAFALAVTVRFDDLNASTESQTVFDLGNGVNGDNIRLSQIGNSNDMEFVIVQDGATHRIVAENVIVEGEKAIWRVGVDADGIMRLVKNNELLAEGQGVVTTDIERSQYLIGESASTSSELAGLVPDLKIANYGNFHELDPSNEDSPCATTGEAVCLCDKLVPDVDDSEGNDAPVIFDEYSIPQGDVTELTNASRGENNAELTATGILAFADADTTDVHTATITPLGDDYLGTLTINAPTTTAAAKTGSVTWNFVISDADLDPLEEGQQVFQHYEIAIDDGNGKVSTKTISVTLNGTDDSVPTEEDFVVVQRLETTSGDDTVILGDNVRVMESAYFKGGENRLEVGDYFELKNGYIDFDNSDGSAYFETGLRPRLIGEGAYGGDIWMDEGGIENTLILGSVAEFSHIRMDGNGAGTRNSVTIGNSSKSDSSIQMDSIGTSSDWAQISLKIGNVVEIGGNIDADGYYAERDFDFGYLVIVHGSMYLNGGYSTENDIKIGSGFTLEGTWYGANGRDKVEIERDWDIDGPLYLNAGDDTLKLGITTVDGTTNNIYGGAGQDTLVLDVESEEISTFETTATSAGWIKQNDGSWDAQGRFLDWKGTNFRQFENVQVNEIGANYAPEIIEEHSVVNGVIEELIDGDLNEGIQVHKVNGTIAFSDQDDIGGKHTVSVNPQGDDYVGEFKYSQPNSAQFGLWPWLFEVTDADIDELGESEQLIQRYEIVITDKSGLSTTEIISISITGAGDGEIVIGTDVQDIANETQYLTGVGDNDVFAINGNSTNFGWGNTQDGEGIVVWGPTGHDLLYDFETIRFNDTDISLVQSGDNHQDIQNLTQYLIGETDAEEAFFIDGNSIEYDWAATEDGEGIVVWGPTGHDLLYNFDKIAFKDQTVSLETPATGSLTVDDDPDVTQHLIGSDKSDRFVIDGDSTEYGWDKTIDETGVVVWNETSGSHDILYEFDEIQFNNQVVEIDHLVG
ncbi:MAG: galactose oxidase early set domain-containing protein [Pseudomonadota bacterium]